LEPVSFVIVKSKLRWFGHAESKEWAMEYITTETHRIIWTGYPSKTL